MQNETIGNVRLNYTFYKGADLYSDGDIEDKLLNVVREDPGEENLRKVLQQESAWPYLYYFSKERHHLLSWYDFKPQGSLLEIGAGCGALTGLFCEKTGKVTAVELSARRSEINACRNRDCDNLEIYVGNFEDMTFEEKYDYVTLIGVWEYASHYLKAEDPFMAMLHRAKELLRPDGTLIIAIENKYGMKYFAGAGEDHTGILFDSVYGYPTTSSVRTFARPRIEEMLFAAGFPETAWYYPYPDYKIPTCIFSDGHVPRRYEIPARPVTYDRARVQIFDESEVLRNMATDGYYGAVANSFLIFAGEMKWKGRVPDLHDRGTVCCAAYNDLCKPEYRRQTTLSKETEGMCLRVTFAGNDSEDPAGAYLSVLDLARDNLQNVRVAAAHRDGDAVVVAYEDTPTVMEELTFAATPSEEIARYVRAKAEELLASKLSGKAFPVLGIRFSDITGREEYTLARVLCKTETFRAYLSEQKKHAKGGSGLATVALEEIDWQEFAVYFMVTDLYAQESQKIAARFLQQREVYLDLMGFDEAKRSLYAALLREFDEMIHGKGLVEDYTLRYEKEVQTPEAEALAVKKKERLLGRLRKR